MKASIVTGGKQYTVSEGDVLYIEKLNAEEEATVKFEQVLAVLDGENTKIGAPVVEGACVEAKVVKDAPRRSFPAVDLAFLGHLQNRQPQICIGIQPL